MICNFALVIGINAIIYHREETGQVLTNLFKFALKTYHYDKEYDES
jgi:hypothetical protein